LAINTADSRLDPPAAILPLSQYVFAHPPSPYGRTVGARIDTKDELCSLSWIRHVWRRTGPG